MSTRQKVIIVIRICAFWPIINPVFLTNWTECENWLIKSFRKVFEQNEGSTNPLPTLYQPIKEYWSKSAISTQNIHVFDRLLTQYLSNYSESFNCLIKSFGKVFQSEWGVYQPSTTSRSRDIKEYWFQSAIFTHIWPIIDLATLSNGSESVNCLMKSFRKVLWLASQRFYCIYIIAAPEGCIETKSLKLTRMADNEEKCHVTAFLIDLHDFSVTSE